MPDLKDKKDVVEMVAVELSDDAKKAMDYFIPTLTYAGGQKMIKSLEASFMALVRADKMDKAKFALALADYLKPKLAAIPVVKRAPAVVPEKPAEKPAAKSTAAKPTGGKKLK